MPKKIFAIGAAALAFFAVEGKTALADCLDEVRTIFAEHLDARNWPPYRSVRIHKNADGDTLYGMDIIAVAPDRMITHSHGRTAVLMVGRETWTGPEADGPWEKAPNHLPENPLEAYGRQHAEQLANLEDAECHGTVDVDGESLIHYSFTTQTDPDGAQGGTWFGFHRDIYLDPETRLPMRRDMSDFVAHYRTEPDGETASEVFTWDPDVEVAPPE